MGSLNPRPAPKGLLRERPARCHGGRRAHARRRLLWNNGWSGLRLGRQRRFVDTHRPRSSGGAFRRSPDASMIRVVLPYHLRTLARLEGEAALELNGAVTLAAV